MLAGAIYWGRSRSEEARHRRRVEEIIEFLELERYRKEPIAHLGFGLQKLVAIAPGARHGAQAPATGRAVDRDESRREGKPRAFLLRIKHEVGIAMLWVEHDMELVADLADHVTALRFGEKLAAGPPDSVLSDRRVVEAHLGRAFTRPGPAG